MQNVNIMNASLAIDPRSALRKTSTNPVKGANTFQPWHSREAVRMLVVMVICVIMVTLG